MRESFDGFLRMTSQTRTSGQLKCDLLLQCYKTQYLEKEVKQIEDEEVRHIRRCVGCPPEAVPLL